MSGSFAQSGTGKYKAGACSMIVVHHRFTNLDSAQDPEGIQIIPHESGPPSLENVTECPPTFCKLIPLQTANSFHTAEVVRISKLCHLRGVLREMVRISDIESKRCSFPYAVSSISLASYKGDYLPARKIQSACQWDGMADQLTTHPRAANDVRDKGM